jgi:endoglucanase
MSYKINLILKLKAVIFQKLIEFKDYFMKLLLQSIALFFLAGSMDAATSIVEAPILTPQPTTCINSSFTSTGDKDWQDIILKLTNNCGKPVDLQNSAFNFLNSIPLNVSFWGDFLPLSYPDNDLKLTSQLQADNKYLVAFRLHFHVHPGANSILLDSKSITIKFGAVTESHIGNVSAYIGVPIATGTITLTNIMSKPVGVNQNYARVHLSTSRQKITDIQLGWSESQDIKDLTPGVYTISAENISNTTGGIYNGSAVPASITLAADQVAKASIKYALASDTGQITIQLQALPTELSGYTEKPIASLSQISTGSSVSAPLEWNMTTTVPKLQADNAYRLAAGSIIYNGFQCMAFFSPDSVIARNTPDSLANLSYRCVQVIENNTTINVVGAPDTLGTLFMTLTPGNGLPSLRTAIKLTNGSGSNIVKLTNAAIYKVSSFAVAGYQITYDPQPLVSTADAVENVILTPNPLE